MVLVIRRMALALVCLVVMLAGMIQIFRSLPTSFVPNEDQGQVIAAVIMPDSASLDRTEAVAESVGTLFARDPAVHNVAQITGFSVIDGGLKTNAATLFVQLKDFEERYASIATALAQNARPCSLACTTRRG